MAIITKNQKLKTQVFKRMDIWDKKALKAYKDGDMKNGKKFEDKSDKIYKDNYYKMFEVKKN